MVEGCDGCIASHGQAAARAGATRQEAAEAIGVTFLMHGGPATIHGARAYDAVYDAPRPELFFKSMPEKVSGPGEPVGIRADAKWNVPEPELALVMNSRAELVGVTIGNDMSSRDIEGENLLYLPQAKIYERSCALGPWITTGATEAAIRDWTIGVTIERGGRTLLRGIGLQLMGGDQRVIGRPDGAGHAVALRSRMRFNVPLKL